MSEAGNNAFPRLAALSRLYATAAQNLPAQADVAHTRTAVCFRVLGADVAILLDEVQELLEAPACTRLPRVKPWVKGVANVRGSLTPIIDLALFLGGRLQSAPKKQRIMIIDAAGITAGLLVDDVIGMKHFRIDSYSENRDRIPPLLGRFAPGVFLSDDQCWALFRPEALFRHAGFLDVAA